jgi:hypothetical protein
LYDLELGSYVPTKRTYNFLQKVEKGFQISLPASDQEQIRCAVTDTTLLSPLPAELCRAPPHATKSFEHHQQICQCRTASAVTDGAHGVASLASRCLHRGLLALAPFVPVR